MKATVFVQTPASIMVHPGSAAWALYESLAGAGVLISARPFQW